MTKINDFWGDQAGISAKKEALLASYQTLDPQVAAKYVLDDLVTIVSRNAQAWEYIVKLPSR